MGVLVFQMPIGRINDIMQQQEGMGESGETYIVGADGFMRSDSRFSEESTILKTQVSGATVDKGLAGERGVEIVLDYRGIPVMSAYTPVEFFGTKWVVLAEIDEAEVLLPVVELRNFLIIAALILLAVAGLLGVFAARQVTSPLARITEAIDKVAGGDLAAEIPGTGRSDEIGEMAKSLVSIRDSAAEAGRLHEMVENMPINIMMCEPKDFTIQFLNKTSRETLAGLESYLPVKASEIMGQSIDIFHKAPEHQRRILSDPKNLPHRAKIKLGPETLDLRVNAIVNTTGNYMGPMLAWSVVTQQAKLAETFEASVGKVVSDVGTSAQDVRSSANIVVGTAEETNSLAASVASAAEQASVNVQTVASAAEELSASITEINRRVSQSSEMSALAADKANRTNDQIQGLVEAADKIGKVIDH